jgi:hypothetical protein
VECLSIIICVSQENQIVVAHRSWYNPEQMVWSVYQLGNSSLSDPMCHQVYLFIEDD